MLANGGQNAAPARLSEGSGPFMGRELAAKEGLIPASYITAARADTGHSAVRQSASKMPIPFPTRNGESRNP